MAGLNTYELAVAKHISKNHPQFDRVLQLLNQFLVMEAVKTLPENSYEEAWKNIDRVKLEPGMTFEKVMITTFPDFHKKIGYYIDMFFENYA